MVDVFEVDLHHVQGAIAGLGQLLDRDELALDGGGAPGGVETLVVALGVRGAVAEVVGCDGFADVGGGGVRVANAHFKGLGETAPDRMKVVLREASGDYIYDVRIRGVQHKAAY